MELFCYSYIGNRFIVGETFTISEDKELMGQLPHVGAQVDANMENHLMYVRCCIVLYELIQQIEIYEIVLVHVYSITTTQLTCDVMTPLWFKYREVNYSVYRKCTMLLI